MHFYVYRNYDNNEFSFIYISYYCVGRHITNNEYSTQLQQKSTTLGKAVSVINGVIKTLKDKRSNIAFSDVWSSVKLFAESYDVQLYSIGSYSRMLLYFKKNLTK